MCRITVFFFFQAEDGIRDLIVTGVQTCALPISPDRRPQVWQVEATEHPVPVSVVALGAADGAARRRRIPPVAAQGGQRQHLLVHPIRLGGLDRKSTRLNSSHDQISYAGFCLEKKKKTH